jgi:hypothetical protein
MLYGVFLPLLESRTPFKLRLLARDQIQINGGVAIQPYAGLRRERHF